MEGNYIGTDVTGKLALGNNDGLDFTNASYATIGGTVKGAGNLHLGQYRQRDRLFCHRLDGRAHRGQPGRRGRLRHACAAEQDTGIRIAGPTNCTIGGTIAAAANVISANGGDGVNLDRRPEQRLARSGQLYRHRFRGLTSSATRATAWIVWSDDVTIGGTAAGDGNVIAYNGTRGFSLFSTSTTIRSFPTRSTTTATWESTSATARRANHPNEQGFTLPAPNDYQNYPVLTSATSTANSTEVIGTLNAAASTTYLIQFFANLKADPSGYGQGQLYLGSATVKTGRTTTRTSTPMLTTAMSRPAGLSRPRRPTRWATRPSFHRTSRRCPVPTWASRSPALPSPVAYVGSTLDVYGARSPSTARRVPRTSP